MKCLYYVAGTEVLKIKQTTAANTFKVYIYEKETIIKTIKFSMIFSMLLVIFLFFYVHLETEIHINEEIGDFPKFFRGWP